MLFEKLRCYRTAITTVLSDELVEDLQERQNVKRCCPYCGGAPWIRGMLLWDRQEVGVRGHRARSEDHTNKGDTIMGLRNGEEVGKASSNHRRKSLCHKFKFFWGTVTSLAPAGRVVQWTSSSEDFWKVLGVMSWSGMMYHWICCSLTRENRW